MILFFRMKMKDDLSQKNPWKYDIFFKCYEKMVFPKTISLEYDITCIIWKDFFFSWKHDIFSLDWKWKMIFLKKCMEIWYFLYMRINVTKIILPFCQKKIGRRRTPTLKKKLSFKFCHQNSVIEAGCLNFANS